MRPWYLFLFAGLACLIGAVHLGGAIATNRTGELAGPWFFLGLLASWAGSLLVAQDRRLGALEAEVARLRTISAEPGAAPDCGGI